MGLIPAKAVEKIQAGAYLDFKELLVDNIALVQRLQELAQPDQPPLTPTTMSTRMRAIGDPLTCNCVGKRRCDTSATAQDAVVPTSSSSVQPTKIYVHHHHKLVIAYKDYIPAPSNRMLLLSNPPQDLISSPVSVRLSCPGKKAPLQA